MAVEALEGRALLNGSRFFFNHKVGIEVNNTNDVRDGEPQFGSGTAVNVHPRFAPFYKGPKEPQLLGTAASARVTLNASHNPNTIILTGTVAGTINTRPTTTAQGAIYTFGIDRGGAPEDGPFPGHPNIRFDSEVVVSITPKGVSGYTQYIDSIANLPTTKVALAASAISIQANTLTVTIPATLPSSGTNAAFPSSGKAINQWSVVFFPSFPATPLKISDVASLVPQHTNFQVFYPPFAANFHP